MSDELIERVARALARADSLDYDEVCGVDADPDNGYCDSGTCIAAHWEDHDAEQARRWYLHLSRAGIAAIEQDRAALVAEIVAWLREDAPQWGHEALADAIAAKWGHGHD